MTNKLMRFEVDSASIVDEPEDSHFATAKIRAFHTGLSRHDTDCDIETLKRTAPTLYEKPIIFEFNESFQDFGTHNEKTTIPAGFVVPNSAEFEDVNDGRTALFVMAKIWKKYSRNFLDIFQSEHTTRKNVSVEMEVKDYNENEDGTMTLKDFAYAAVCVLGSMVTEASPDAAIDMLSFSKEYEQDYKMEFAKYAEIDFEIPSGVKKNAKEGLALYGEHKKGGSSVSLATARFLVKNSKATPEKIRQMEKYFSRHSKSEKNDKKGSEWIAWQLWGGNSGLKWSSQVIEQMNNEDDKRLFYYESKEEMMPYASMKDVNPAIKGINPPVTLSQANQIAKEADGIGSDDKKNGWAIAIGNFKKRHTVKDGKWVAKEKMAEYAKEDMGKGEALKVDKSKDAMSDSSWGDVDKIALRDKVLGASNYKSLVKDVYALVEDGWEDAPSSHLKYPIMQLKGGTLVYNRYGLSSALQRAEGQNESAVVSKIHGIYKKLGLDETNKEDKSKMAKENEEFAEDEAKKGQQDEEADESKQEEEKEKENKTEMAVPNYAEMFSEEDFAKMFADEEGDSEETKSKFASAKEEYANPSNPAIMMAGMYAVMQRMMAKMEKMAEDQEAYMAENAKLKEDFARIEEEKKSFEINSFMKEYAEKYEVSEEKLSEMKNEGLALNFAELDGWKNKYKALSYDMKVKASSTDNDTGVNIYGLHFTASELPKIESVWDKLNK